MARLFTSGFETGGTTDWTAVNAGGASVQTATALIGTYSGRTNAMTSATVSGWRKQFVGTNNNGPYYSRAYLQVHTLPTASNRVYMYANATFSGIAWMALNSDSTLTLADEDGTIGAASSPLVADTPYLLELLVDSTAAAGSHIVTGRLNSVAFASASNRNLSTGVSYIRIGGNLGTEAQTQADWYWDNIAVNDTTGPQQTSWPTDKINETLLNNYQFVSAGDGMSVSEKIR